MALPTSNSAWPPATETGRQDRIAVNSVWYGGDPTKLADLYSDGSGQQRTTHNGLRGYIERVASWFWSTSDPNEPDDKVHMPLAQDIATMSSEVLFGEPVQFEVQPDPSWVADEDGKFADAQQQMIDAAQKRLDTLLDGMGFESTLLASAETAAALGSVGLRIAYDKRLGMSQPFISRVDADHVVAEYQFGALVAVTFWEIIDRSHEVWTYHLERHEPGVVYHGLYRGTRGNLGQQLPLADHPATAPYAELVDETSGIRTEIEGMLAAAIPNMLPDPLDRGNDAGRSDYTPGVLTLFDSVDRTLTSLMRDIADGRSRLLVANYMLQNRGVGKGVEWNADQHLFVGLNKEPGENGDAPIDQVQFKIRVDEHLRTLDYLTKKVVESCGYNVDAETGDGAAAPMTATEYSGRGKKTLRTRDKKLLYWRRLEALLTALLAIDAKQFQSGVTPLPVRMIVPDMLQPTLLELGNTAKVLREAQAASTQIIVETVHPDWSPDMVDEEVARILEENGAADPALVGVPGAPDAPGAPLPQIDDEESDDVASPIG